MKHTKHLLSIFLICAAFILAACSHDDAPVQGYTITGKIEFKANALPTQTQAVNNVRMATIDGAASGFYIDCSASTVTAVHKTTGFKIRGSVLNPSTDNYGYTVTIPSPGQWLIQISASYGSTSYYGETEVVVIEYNGYLKIPDYDDNYMPDNVSVSLFPLFNEGIGTIRLTVKNMLTPASTDAATDTYTVKMSWLSDKPDSLDAQYSATLSYAYNSSAVLQVNNVPAGAYEVEIQFIDKNGKLVYSCNQWIHVFAGQTTNTWYGTGLDYISQGYDTYLALTQEAVADYALNNPQIQYSAKSLIYKYETTGLSYELVTDNVYPDSFTSSLSIGTFTLSDSVSVTGQSFTDSFCYGNNDSVYFSGIVSGIAPGSDIKKYSVLYKAGESSAELFAVIKPEIIEGEENAYAINALYYDRYSDYIYGITQGKYGADSYFPQFFVYEVKNPGEKLNFYKGSLRSNAPVKAFIVKDGYLYIPEYDSTEGNLLLKCYLLGGEYNLFEIPGKNITVANLGINHSVEITDMLCLDQDLFILVNDSLFSLGELCSRGAVIKYNFETADAETTGLAGEDLFYGNNDVKFNCSAKSSEVLAVFTDDTFQEEYKIIIVQSNYAPADEDAELFYGPQKILSYDNEYLYIADSGNKYSSEGVDGTIVFEPVNRIVKFNIADMEIDSPVAASDGSFVIPLNNIFTTDSEGYDQVSDLYDNNAEPCDKVYPYIPKKN